MIQTLLGPFFSLRRWFHKIRCTYIRMLPYGTQQCSVLVHPVFQKWPKPTGGLLGKEITKVDLFYLTGMPMLNVEQLKYFGDLKLSNT